MTMEEKQAIIKRNIEKDPALMAECQELAARLASPENAAEKLEVDPEFSARYAAIMAKAANGMEMDDEELGDVSGGMSFVPGIFQSLLRWMFGGTQLPTAEPASSGKPSAQAVTLGYDTAKGVSTSHAVYDPANPVSPGPLGISGTTDREGKLL